jgi:putative transposase
MPRRARLRIAAVPLHLIQRGNNRSACFFDQVDYTFYLDHLRELTLKFSCAVHAYVLVTNHVHLLMTAAKDDGPSLLMKHLGQRYVQYVNRLYGRSGTMWEGRFRSSIVQQRAYLLRWATPIRNAREPIARCLAPFSTQQIYRRFVPR